MALFWGGNGNCNGNQLGHYACMLAPTPREYCNWRKKLKEGKEKWHRDKTEKEGNNFSHKKNVKTGRNTSIWFISIDSDILTKISYRRIRTDMADFDCFQSLYFNHSACAFLGLTI